MINDENGKDSQEMALTRKLFPKGAIIKKLENGNYNVEAEFENDMFLNGGQKVELILHRKTQPYLLFEVEKFVVNNQKLNTQGTKIFISGEGLLEDTTNSREYQTEVYFGKNINIIFFRSFKTSAAIASYFHELGHINKSTEDISKSDLNEICCKLHNIDYKNMTPELKELFRKYMYDERQASIRALKSAKLYKNIFDDNDIFDLKKFYSKMLNMKMDCPDAFRSGESEVVIDLDQDWHY